MNEMTYCTTAKDCSTCSRAGTCDWNGTNKWQVFDILKDILPADTDTPFRYVEVRFKNTRKAFYYTRGHSFYVGQPVTVQAASGYDVGVVSAAGETARLIAKEQGLNLTPEESLHVLHPANQREINRWHENRAKEESTKLRAREIARELGLVMKISDVEYQADGSKATFYYTAEERVDFRELIKLLAKEFSTRIEMRQIGYRQEAARLGAIGSCGRELCCSTWLTDFRSVSTQAAKYQQLSLNPGKLTGQCGKLKCCLNFELDSYLDALTEFPQTDIILSTEKGDAKYIKMDVFKNLMWYAYTDSDNGHMWYKLNTDQVNEIIELNKEGKKSAPLEFYADELKLEIPANQLVSSDDLLGDNINRFDEKPKKRRKKRRKKSGRKPPQNQNQAKQDTKKNRPQGGTGQPKNQKGDRPVKKRKKNDKKNHRRRKS